jgi:hypothetical protein
MVARIYDHELIAVLRSDGIAWGEIAGRLGGDAETLRKTHWAWAKRQENRRESRHGGTVVQKWMREPEGTYHVKMPVGTDMKEEVAAFWADAQQSFEEWLPRKEPPPVTQPEGGGLAVLSIYDAHFGLRADPAETGGDAQDLGIISRTYRTMADRLVALSRIYQVERYLIPVGHDMSHVNAYMAGGRGMVTRAGTEQDVGDSRLWKIYKAVCEAAVYMIDTARSTGRPVDVVLVPGNHDPDENYKLGEFLRAWYRHDDAVVIQNDPRQHKYYAWGTAPGGNVFMLTHGEHYMRKGATSPLLTFAAECPPELWNRRRRFILSGHFHARRQGQYTPTSDVTEDSAIVSYVLPALCATDEWHYRQGYRSQRAATLQIFRQEGGLLAHHEIQV